MFFFYLKNALKSMRRTPVLTGLLVLVIGLATATVGICFQTYIAFVGDPMPHKSDQLYHLELDIRNPSADDNAHNILFNKMPHKLSYKDVMALKKSDIPTYQSANFLSRLAVFPKNKDLRPFKSYVCLCHADFFPMFEVPFKYGGPWNKKADEPPEPVVVLSEEMNQRLFGGENSVGQTLTIEDRAFTVVGVMDAWRPRPKFYDPFTAKSGVGLISGIEEVFMPFHFLEEMETRHYGSTHCFATASNASSFKEWLQKECTWMYFWVQLDTVAQKAAYLGFLKTYGEEQVLSGRFHRPLPARILTVNEWLEKVDVTEGGVQFLLLVGYLFLIGAAVNLIGILLGKFLARSPHIALHRAMGATRGSVFLTHLLECEFVALVGGLLGVVLNQFVGASLNRSIVGRIFERFAVEDVATVLIVAVIAGLIAGVYPSWRICRISPASALKG
ncbi:MAG: ABC transporter permease [Myxococcota bacterium]|nr:ABC transporter permease [Myxococcota bacterium]